MQKEYLTKDKYDELVKELEILKTVKRKELAENLEYAKSLGDLSENAEYQEARDNQAAVEDRIAKLEAVLRSAEIISDQHQEAVSVGSSVIIERFGGGRQNYTIVGSEEADAKAGKISFLSPLGAALMGKKAGDDFEFLTPKGLVKGRVISIN
jgi:transcription elongation factor GreA